LIFVSFNIMAIIMMSLQIKIPHSRQNMMVIAAHSLWKLRRKGISNFWFDDNINKQIKHSSFFCYIQRCHFNIEIFFYLILETEKVKFYLWIYFSPSSYWHKMLWIFYFSSSGKEKLPLLILFYLQLVSLSGHIKLWGF